MINLGISTLYTKDILAYSLLTTKNKEMYCNLRNYNFLYHNEKLDDRPPAWSKILFVQKNLSKFDWILWIDADAIFTNFEVKIEDLIDDNYNFIIGVENKNKVVNSGVFLIKNCSWSFDFLFDIYASKEFEFHKWWENIAIIELLKKNKYLEKSLFLSQNSINSFISCYNPGDFILHFVGEDKIKIYDWILFDNYYYYSKNKDVLEAVKKGIFKNGYDHFIKHGYKEGRYFKLKL